jgi:two-component system, chemotaxis family, protein-glutamate methylesterase/glutaminase
MINIVIADDSAFLRKVLKEVLEESGKIKVAGLAKNGKEAIALVKELSPDVLILDCEMPVMEGLEALGRIMKECPLPVFMFSSFTASGADITIKALELGAVDFLQKPSSGAHGLDEVSEDLIKKLETVTSLHRKKDILKLSVGRKDVRGIKPPLIDKRQKNIDLIVVGSSAGGVGAAVEIVKDLPAKMKPILWVQHMPETFTRSFAQRLNSISRLTVKEAEDGEEVRADHCYIAKGGYQMRAKLIKDKIFLEINDKEKVSGHCPSCDALFESVSDYFADNALGVILTGMGKDGTKGLVAMHKKGAFVIGQNEESSVVYGMPKSALIAGAVDLDLDIHDIADALIKMGGESS